MKELEWSQAFPLYNPMEAICCHWNQSSDLMEEAFGSGELKRALVWENWTVNFYNTLLVILTVNCCEFIQHSK